MDITDIFDQAATLRGQAREQFLIANCQDAEVLAEVRALLAADEVASDNEAWNLSALQNAASAPDAQVDPAIGETVGAYRIVEAIGSGGMGKVYRAVRADAEYEKSVALKRIKRGLDADQIIARFRAERQILANLEHPNIARLLDGGADSNGLPYIVMEFIGGTPPLAYAEAHTLSLAARLRLGQQICAAVHYAHQRMVIHRDLKPGNILVANDGTPKLLDFGLGKMFEPATADSAAFPPTEAGMHLMTVRYASPEQVRGENVTTATDIYSLGVLLYELLTAHSPYRNPDRPLHELMRAVCDEDVIKPSTWRPELRGDIDNILLKALDKDAAKRYASADQFSQDIQCFLEGLPVQARGQTFSYVAAKFVRRNKIAVASACVGLLILVAALIGVSRARSRAERRFNDVRRLAHSVIFDYHDAIETLPGSTPVRARLVKDALEYLDSLARDGAAGDAGLQREMVDAYVRISNVQGDSYHANLGDTAGAMVSAKKSIEVADRLVNNDRSLPSLQSAATAYNVLGTSLFQAGDLQGADRSFKRSVELNEAAERIDPNNIDTVLSRAETLRHLGDLYGGGGGGMQNLGRTAECLDFYKRADQAAAQLATRIGPNVTGASDRIARSRQQTLQMMAESESGMGRAADATAHMEEAVRLIEAVAARNPQSTSDQYELSSASLSTGLRLRDANKPAEALPYIQRTITILEKLIVADPKNTLYQRSLSVTENHYATMALKAGDAAAALPHNRKSLALAESLRAIDPNSVEYRNDLAISHRKLSETMLAAGEGAGALDQALQAQALLCGSGVTDAFQQTHCGRAMLAAGNAQMKLGNRTAAASAYVAARDLAVKLSQADPANTVLHADVTRAEAGITKSLSAGSRR